MIGTIIDGKYRITRQLGAGAMGAVYEAEHTATGRRVAVKVITSGFANNPDLIGRFKQEAMAAGRIETKHITQVLDAGVDRDSGLPFMVMEFLTGADIQHLIKKVGPIAPELALRIGAQACLGLQKAHDAGVVHRDIKPANLFLAESDGDIVVKVLDFGIAKVHLEQAHETESAHLTRTGSLLGSPLYMSPEQARGSKGIDARADVWSLGATLYHCLAGRSPYQHITALGELIYVICSEPPPSVQQFAPWVSPEVAAIVHGCLRQNPDERFQSTKDMLAAIRPLLPHGWVIQPEMLVPISEEAKTAKVTAYSLPPAAPYTNSAAGAQTAVGGSLPPPGFAAHPEQGSNPGMGAPPQGSSSHPGTASNPGATSQSGSGALVQSQSAATKPSRSPFIVATIGAVVVLGGGGFYLVRGNSQPLPTPQQVTQASTLPPKSAATPLVASAPPPTASAAVETASAALIKAKLLIAPRDAQVYVNDKLTTVNAVPLSTDGSIDIEGKPGTQYLVKLKKGTSEKTDAVVLTSEGILPPRMALAFGALPGKTGPTPTTTSTPSGFKGSKDFE